MATVVEAPVEAMPNEPEANKLFRMVMKFRELQDLRAGRSAHGSSHAAGRRAAADAASAAVQ